MRRDPHIPPTMRGWLHKQVGLRGTAGWGGCTVVGPQVTGEGGFRGTVKQGVLGEGYGIWGGEGVGRACGGSVGAGG